MNENDDLIRRLRALGRHSVDPAVASSHLSKVTSPSASGGRSHRLRTAGVFLAGLLLGGTGLASAGALPAPAQKIAHDTLGAVGVKVPGGERYQGVECGGAKNHGQYVRSQPKGERAAAAKSLCGKKTGSGEAKPDKADKPGKSGCEAPPPWAGQGKSQDKAAKKAAQAQRRATCGDDDEKEEPAKEGKGQAPAITGESTTTTATTEPVEESSTTTTTEPVDESTTTTSTTLLPVSPPITVTPPGS